MNDGPVRPGDGSIVAGIAAMARARGYSSVGAFLADRLCEDGASIAELAAELSLPPATVEAMLSVNGLPIHVTGC